MPSQKRTCGAGSSRGAWLRLVFLTRFLVWCPAPARRVGDVSRGSPVVVLAVMRRLRRPSARRRRRVERQTTSYSESPFVAGLGWQRCVVRVYFGFF